jgi:hypothetical protein
MSMKPNLRKAQRDVRRMDPGARSFRLRQDRRAARREAARMIEESLAAEVINGIAREEYEAAYRENEKRDADNVGGGAIYWGSDEFDCACCCCTGECAAY